MTETVAVAFVGLAGAVVGSFATVVGHAITHWLSERSGRMRDEPRRRLLTALLEDPRFEWRNLDTLAHVIGADEDTTKRLLIDVGARGSEDGQSLWALVKRKPLDKQ